MSNISSSERVSKLLSEVSSSLIVPHVALDATTNSLKAEGTLTANGDKIKQSLVEVHRAHCGMAHKERTQE